MRFSAVCVVAGFFTLGVPLALAEEPEGADEKPAAEAPAAHTNWKRDGVNPCMTPDPGFLAYDKWENVALGQIIAPSSGGLRKGGGFDLIVHFHGHEPTRKEFVKADSGIVLAGIDLGIGSGPYEEKFADPSVFPRLLESIEARMKKRSGNDRAHVQHLALSSWSAGYGAISQILKQDAGRKVEAIILLDSLHAGYEPGDKSKVRAKQLEQFTDFARLAAKKKKFMFLSHSSIVPPGYASTTEVARHIVEELGGQLKKASRKDVLGLQMIARFDRGDFHVRGYDGNDKPDHCAHIGLIKDVVKTHLWPKWKTPRPKPRKTAAVERATGQLRKGAS